MSHSLCMRDANAREVRATACVIGSSCVWQFAASCAASVSFKQSKD